MNTLTLKSNYLNLNPKFYQLTSATPLANPRIASYNLKLAEAIGLSQETLESKEFTDFINGTFWAEGSKPHAMGYCGHQFGFFVPNLGDGRALNLGSTKNYHLQLKGAGETAYSRGGDGRAVLRSSIREYLMSEAMYGLSIPTSRALGIIASDTVVQREGRETGSIVLRASPSWVRFGTFELFNLESNSKENLTALADFVIRESYPHLIGRKNSYEELYFAIVDKTIELLVLWQSVGFMHGVMNTDNMSIAGLTIDYGPYAFMDRFEKGKICNHSDYEGRYSFENQPYIAQWNLLVLARAFSPIADEKLIVSYTNTFIGKFNEQYFDLMAKKLGIFKKSDETVGLIQSLLFTLEACEIDYTAFFYNLSCGNFEEIKNLGNGDVHIHVWLEWYAERLALESVSTKQRLEEMQHINPKYVLKNYMLQEAIEGAESGDFSLLNSLLEIAQNPYAQHEEFERYAKSTPKEFCEILCSCSS
jgi:uncharacterized protein YdiU (UPF0061 family)